MIRIITVLFLMIFTATQSNAQLVVNKDEPSTTYIKEAVAFLTTVKKKEFSDSSFTLVDVPKYACFSFTVDDSVNFSNEELDQLVNEIEFPKVSNWRAILPSNIRFLAESFVLAQSKVIKNAKRETNFFNRKFGGCYHHFSAPIFLRNYTFCLMYVDKICAGGKSHGELQVFEKNDGVWEQLPSRCEWTE
jgi:hypothetical protein